MDETMFYMTLEIQARFLKNKSILIDCYYNAIKEITKDYLKSEECKKDVGLLDSIFEYTQNNKRLILYIMNREQVTDEEIVKE